VSDTVCMSSSMLMKSSVLLLLKAASFMQFCKSGWSFPFPTLPVNSLIKILLFRYSLSQFLYCMTSLNDHI
jgi:hypothetical protein